MNSNQSKKSNSIIQQIVTLYDKMEIYLTLAANQENTNDSRSSISVKAFTSNMCVLSKLLM